PLVHVEDLCRAFVAVLHAPRHVIHNVACNVGRTDENYRVRELAELVQEAIPASRITYAPGAGPDARSYQVECAKLAAALPEFRPRWTVPQGIAQLRDAFGTYGL